MILVSDFDDTLCPRDDEPTFKENLCAVQKFRQAGNLFCLATGRSLSSLKRRWTDFQQYSDYVILDNGSICLNQQEQIMFERTIPLSIAQNIRQRILSDFSTRVKIGFVYYHDMSEWQSADTDITKLRCWVSKDDIVKQVSEMLNRDFATYVKAFPVFNAFASGLPWLDQTVNYTAFIDIVSRAAGKDQAITQLHQLLNLHTAVATVGDDVNDLAMIQEFNGYAMQKSTPALLDIVEPTHIVPSVSDLIQKLLEQE